MELRKSQAVSDIVLTFPLITRDGAQAVGVVLNTLSTKIIAPDGSVVSSYTEATFSEPNSDGEYVVSFPSNAANKAFTLVDQSNPYTITLDSTSLGVEPTSKSVWIVSKFPWELPTAVQIREEMDTNSDLVDIKAKTDLIGTSQAIVVQTIAQDLTIYIVRGCDYASADGKQISFTFNSFDISGYTLRINIEKGSSGYVTKELTIDGAVAKAELTASETSQLTAGIRRYDVEALKDGRVVSLISRSKAIIYEDVK